MTDADQPASGPDDDFSAPESPCLPDIDSLFPMISPDDSPPPEELAETETLESQDKQDEELLDIVESDESLEPPPETPEEDQTLDEPAGPTAVIRYGMMGFLGEFRYNQKHKLRSGTKVVIRTDRGVELGEVISLVNRSTGSDAEESRPAGNCITPDTLTEYLKTSSENYPFRRGGRVLRPANPQDLIDYRHLHNSAGEESRYCREQIKERNLPMRLVKAEHMLGGERIVFYFTAETRVDFRSLVRDLASQFRTRIEMRQVGARDEARLVADYERCGQPCCCKEFLKDLKPVSMRMAKVQKATLDPTKISGRCGRLMCCLRYEDECYEELKKTLPRRNSWVRTKGHIGRVVDGQIITQLVRLALYDGTFAVVPVEEILERNLEPPSEEQLREHAAKQAALQRAEAKKAAELEAESLRIPPAEAPSVESSEEAPTPATPDGEDARKKHRRRRRRKKNPGEGDKSKTPGAKGQSQGQAKQKNRPKPAPSSGDGSETTSHSKRRRGRRRKKKPDTGGGEGA
ncbi:MAG: hypothetical protein JXA11_13580 [Phycisphaerae bacterium]|nr:hypothetical protein [Phycisphaerae bacterium]